MLISIHAPHAGCDATSLIRKIWSRISIHAPHAGCDIRIRNQLSPNGHFNPRTPCGVRPGMNATGESDMRFQSTHPMRGATGGSVETQFYWAISIHAPHAGCDVIFHLALSSFFWISIHAPHAGCDETDGNPVGFYVISIHAPHAGCDRRKGRKKRRQRNFNPRTPCGVRRDHGEDPVPSPVISIHAPHAGCDDKMADIKAKAYNFNPRTPCGVRLSMIQILVLL